MAFLKRSREQRYAKERFNLLLLDLEEYFFEQHPACHVMNLDRGDERKVRGSLKICSKSIIFEPDEASKPILKIALRDCLRIDVTEEKKPLNPFAHYTRWFAPSRGLCLEEKNRSLLGPNVGCGKNENKAATMASHSNVPIVNPGARFQTRDYRTYIPQRNKHNKNGGNQRSP